MGFFTIAQHTGLDIKTCDVSNAFVTAPNSEKVWAIAGDEFGEKKGSKVEIQRALYGLPGSPRPMTTSTATAAPNSIQPPSTKP